MRHDTAPSTPAQSLSKGSAIRFVLLLGVVSLFADMTYEGARGVTSPFLETLGANGMTVGIVAGLGELVGLDSGLSRGSGQTGQAATGHRR